MLSSSVASMHSSGGLSQSSGVSISRAPPSPAAPPQPSSQQPPSVPVWRSVGEKSALRGYLSVLGVTPEASLSDIRGAYKKLALQWHPDRSDAPNARLKFQEISAAYMALCVEEGDAQEIDVALYEKANQQQQQHYQQQQQQFQTNGLIGGKADSFAAGLAGVTAGLAGVFTNALGVGGGLNSGAFSPYLSLSPHKAGTAYELYPQQQGALHKHLGGHHHGPGCACHGVLPPPALHSHAHAHSHTHAHSHASCQCHTHSPHCHAHGSSAAATNGKSLLEPAAAGGVTISELDAVAGAVQADVAHSGVLPPPLLSVSEDAVRITIHPLPQSAGSVIYQVQLKIKKTYQLVYVGSGLTYSIPVADPASFAGAAKSTHPPFFLLPGTRYMFRVRACPAVGAATTTGDSDDDAGGLTDALLDELSDVAADEGIFSQPASSTTLGTKPEGNAPHPPVLSNLQLAALKRKEKKKKKGNTSSKQEKDAAASSAVDSEEEKPLQPQTSSPSKGGKKKGLSDTPSHSSASSVSDVLSSHPAAVDVDAAATTEDGGSVSSLSASSTPKRGLTRDHSLTDLASAASAAPTAPTTSAAAVAASLAGSASSARKLTKKAERAAQKALEEERRAREAAQEAQRKLEEEIAYQKFIMGAREEAERRRLAEEQAELEKYAKLKRERDRQEQEQRKAQEEAAAAAAAAAGKGKRLSKKEKAAAAAAAASASTPAVTTAVAAAPTAPNSARKGKQAQPATSAPTTAPPATAAATAANPASTGKAKQQQQQHAASESVAASKVASAATSSPAKSTREGLLSTPSAQDKRRGGKDATQSPAMSAAPVPASPLQAVKPAWNLPPTAALPAATPSPAKSSSSLRDSAAAQVQQQPQQQPSPIIKSKPPPGAKAWTVPALLNTPSQQQQQPPQQATSTTMSASAGRGLLPTSQTGMHVLSSQSPSFIPSSVALAAAAAQQQQQRADSLSEHLHRFDGSKPWQPDSVRQQQQQQQHQRSFLHAQQQLQQRDGLLEQGHFRHLSDFSSSLLSGSLQQPSSASHLSVPAISSGWPEDDALDDLQEEIERQRWHASDAALAPAASLAPSSHWTSAGSAQGAGGLHFSSLSSLRSDPFASESGSSHGSSHRGSLVGVGLEHEVSMFGRSTPGSTTGSIFGGSDSRSPSDSLGSALGSAQAFQLQAGSGSFASTVAGTPVSSSSGSLLGSFSSHGFPSAGGLSRDAPTFSPASSAASLQDDALAPVGSGSSSGSLGHGHTRLPLPSSASPLLSSSSGSPSPAVAAAAGGLFSGFGMPSFSSYSSFSSAPLAGGAASGAGSSSGLHADWGNPSAPSSSSSALVVDDSDADLPLFPSHASHGHVSAAAGLQALSGADDDVLIPAGGSSAGLGVGSSGWFNKPAAVASLPFASTTASLQHLSNVWDS